MTRRQLLYTWLVLTALLVGMAAVLLFAGCQAGTTGVARPLSPSTEYTITNAVVAGMHAAQAAAPFPWNDLVTGVGSGILGLLAAWQAFTHSRVSKNADAIKQMQKDTTP